MDSSAACRQVSPDSMHHSVAFTDTSSALHSKPISTPVEVKLDIDALD